MILVTVRRPNSAPLRLAIAQDDDATLDQVLAIACRHFGDPSQPCPPLPKPRKPAR